MPKKVALTTEAPDIDAVFTSARREADYMLKTIGWLQPAAHEADVDEFWQTVSRIAEDHYDYGRSEKAVNDLVLKLPRALQGDAASLIIEAEGARCLAAYVLGLAVGFRMKDGAR